MRFLLMIDRRIIFLLVLGAVVAGTLFPERLRFPIAPSKPVRGVHDVVEALPARAPMMLSLDFDPASAPELEPMARSVLRHGMRRGLRMVTMTHWPGGVALAEQIVRETAMEFDDVVLESIATPSRDVARKTLEVLGSVEDPGTREAILRLAAFGEGAETGRLLEAARAARETSGPGPAAAGAGAGADKPGARDAALAAIVEAAKRIPAEKAFPRRTVNFARQKIVSDAKNRARDLVWHLGEGRVAIEPVPVVAPDRSITGYEIVRVASRKPGIKYGEDYCFLGYKAGAAILMIAMGQNLYSAFPTDKYGAPTRELPVLKDVRSLVDLKYLVTLAAGDTGENWIVYGSGKYGFPMGVGCTAVMAPNLYPYYGSKQITGILGGIKGAWEYEDLVGVPGRGLDAAPVQTVAHLLVMALIVFCNIAYFGQRLTRDRR